MQISKPLLISLLTIVFVVFLPNTSSAASQTYTTPGTYTFTVPGGINSINVSLLGAGGGGAGSIGWGDNHAGGAGGGGGVIENQAMSVFPGQTLSVTVGRGGQHGSLIFNGVERCGWDSNGTNLGTTGGGSSVGGVSVNGGGGGKGSENDTCNAYSGAGGWPWGVGGGAINCTRNVYPVTAGGGFSGVSEGRGGNGSGSSGYGFTCPMSGSHGKVILTWPDPTASFTQSPTCSIASNGAGCNGTASWTSANVPGVSLTNCAGTVLTYAATGAGSHSGVYIPYNSGCYQIRNTANGAVLAQTTGSSWCVSGTNWDGTKCAPPPPPPPEPTFSGSCSLQSNGTYTIGLSWAGTAGAVNYPVRIFGPSAATNASRVTGTYQSITGEGVAGDGAPTASPFNFVGLTAGGSYNYWGHAWNTNGWSTNTVRTVSCTPSTPTSFTGTAGACGTGRITLSWNAVPGASYILYRSGATIYTGSNTTYSDTGLTPGATYNYTLRASAGGAVSMSASTNATAPAVCPVVVNGSCGTAATNYSSGATTYSGTFCSAGTASPASPAFPVQGGSSSWTCLGANGGTNSPSCTATRAAAATTNLSPTALTISAGPYTQGAALSLTGTVQNNGTTNIGAFSDNFTYQWGGTSGAWLPISTVSKASLASGISSTDGPVSFTPNQSGTLYIQYCTDSTGAITETNEGDNCRVSAALTVNVPATTNLTAWSLGVPAGPYTVGTPMSFSGVVYNDGTTNIGPFSDNFTYQWGGFGGAWQQFSTVAKSGGLLAGNTSNDGPVSFTPAQSGTLYVQYCVDSTGTIAEANESVANNCLMSGAMTVNALVVTGNITPTTCEIPANGSSCTTNVTWSTQNATNVRVDAGATTISTGQGNNATGLAHSVTYGNTMFGLYNGGTLLDAEQITVGCPANHTWVGGICMSTLIPPTLTVSKSPVINGSSVTLFWDTNNGDETSCSLTGKGVSDATLDAGGGDPDPERGSVDIVIHGRTKLTLTCGALTAIKTIDIIPASWES